MITVTLHKCYHFYLQEYSKFGKLFGHFTYVQSRFLSYGNKMLASHKLRLEEPNLSFLIIVCKTLQLTLPCIPTEERHWEGTWRLQVSSLRASDTDTIVLLLLWRLQWDHLLTSSCGEGKALGSAKELHSAYSGRFIHATWAYV